jgi:hypothetical protein
LIFKLMVDRRRLPAWWWYHEVRKESTSWEQHGTDVIASR